MSTTVYLTPKQLERLSESLDELHTVTIDGTTFRMPQPEGCCPSCNEAVYHEDEYPDGLVWICPADLSADNIWHMPAHESITEELREETGVYSNCGDDYGFPCYEPLPLHSECYDTL